jgi:thiamine-monophosphate kinase
VSCALKSKGPGHGYAEAMRDKRARAQAGGELALIERIRRAAKHRSGGRSELRLGIGDDCAILRPRRGEEIVVTTDFSLEGRHFRRDWHEPQSVGHRVLARGLSDLAAMGARPVAAFLSLALPRQAAQDAAWVGGFLDGLLALAKRSATPLAGGDTSESPCDLVLADIVLLGAVPQGRALRRDGARPGDRIFVTGALGGAAAQLAAIKHGARQKNVAPGPLDESPHFFPQPRLHVGQVLLAKRLATAAIDLSDGISTDLRHLCKASGVVAEIYRERLPVHTLLQGAGDEVISAATLHGGEDYELLFTADPKVRVPRRIGKVALTEVGRVTEPRRGRSMVTLVEPNGKRLTLAPGGWEHLR